FVRSLTESATRAQAPVRKELAMAMVRRIAGARIVAARILTLTLTLGLAVLTPLSAYAQIPFPRDLIPTRTALGRLGLEQHWMAVVPIVRTERLLSISLHGDLFFAQTNQANFYTFEAESGRLLWSAYLGDETRSAQSASVNSRLVFVTNGNQLFALEKRTG